MDSALDVAAASGHGHGHDKTFDIIINAQEFTVRSETVTYEEIVHLAYPMPPSPETRFTVTYRKAKEPAHEGSLAPGKSVEVKKGTIFNVTPTTKS